MKTLFLLFDDQSVMIICIGLIVFIVVMWAIRELICWYYKINDIVAELRMMNKNLTKLMSPEQKKPEVIQEEKEVTGWKRL